MSGAAAQHLWAQRCKVYIFRTQGGNWVPLGTGKAELVRDETGRGAEFVFEDSSLRIPTVRHPLSTATPLQRNSSSGRGWTWSARDKIQRQTDEEEQWFTAKFDSAESAARFKDVFDRFVGSHEDAHGAVTEHGEDFTAASQASVRVHHAEALPAPHDLGNSPPASPVVSVRAFRAAAGAAVSAEVDAGPGGEAWLLYFERGAELQGGAVREARTVYVGVYGSKAAAIRNAPRAMDLYSDATRPWRQRELWARREDYRRRVGDKGTVLAVKDSDGSYQQTKIRKLPNNRDLEEVVSDNENLWAAA